MSDFEDGYNSYFEEKLYNADESDQWKSGYVKAIEDELNEIFKETEENK